MGYGAGSIPGWQERLEARRGFLAPDRHRPRPNRDAQPHAGFKRARNLLRHGKFSGLREVCLVIEGRQATRVIDPNLDATDVQYEAVQIDSHLSSDLRIFVMATDKGRIAVHMSRVELELRNRSEGRLATKAARLVPPITDRRTPSVAPRMREAGEIFVARPTVLCRLGHIIRSMIERNANGTIRTRAKIRV